MPNRTYEVSILESRLIGRSSPIVSATNRQIVCDRACRAGRYSNGSTTAARLQRAVAWQAPGSIAPSRPSVGPLEIGSDRRSAPLPPYTRLPLSGLGCTADSRRSWCPPSRRGLRAHVDARSRFIEIDDEELMMHTHTGSATGFGTERLRHRLADERCRGSHRLVAVGRFDV